MIEIAAVVGSGAFCVISVFVLIVSSIIFIKVLKDRIK